MPVEGAKTGALLFCAGAMAGGAAGFYLGYTFHDAVVAYQFRKEQRRQRRKEMCEQCIGMTACVALTVVVVKAKFS